MSATALQPASYPVLLELKIDGEFMATRGRVFTPRASWVKASDNDINNYRSTLELDLKLTELPAAALLCTDMRCADADHHGAIGQYAEAIAGACLSAAESSIPRTSSR